MKMEFKIVIGIIQALSIYLDQTTAAPRKRYSRDIKPVGEDREAVVCTVIPESVLQASFPKLVFNHHPTNPPTAKPTTTTTLPTTKLTTTTNLPYYEYFTTTEEEPEPPEPSRLHTWFSGVLKIPAKISENLRTFWSGYITETVGTQGGKRWTIDVPLPELPYLRNGGDPGPTKLMNFYLQRDSRIKPTH